jgi:hypothetical protein
MAVKKADPACPVCHGEGWEGVGSKFGVRRCRRCFPEAQTVARPTRRKGWRDRLPR